MVWETKSWNWRISKHLGGLEGDKSRPSSLSLSLSLSLSWACSLSVYNSEINLGGLEGDKSRSEFCREPFTDNPYMWCTCSPARWKGMPKKRDEDMSREVCVCEGWKCDLEEGSFTVPSDNRLIYSRIEKVEIRGNEVSRLRWWFFSPLSRVFFSPSFWSLFNEIMCTPYEEICGGNPRPPQMSSYYYISIILVTGYSSD